jgi:uncharacterized protein YbaA (DUF1428 family)
MSRGGKPRSRDLQEYRARLSIPAWPARRPCASHPFPPKEKLMNYVDGFVIAVPTANRDSYLALAQMAAEVFKAHGALAVVECWGDDVPEGKLTSFPLAVQRKPDETVVFSWVTWASRAARDAGMKKVMDDDRMKGQQMPFDTQRMIFGGFEVMLSA